MVSHQLGISCSTQDGLSDKVCHSTDAEPDLRNCHDHVGLLLSEGQLQIIHCMKHEAEGLESKSISYQFQLDSGAKWHLLGLLPEKEPEEK